MENATSREEFLGRLPPGELFALFELFPEVSFFLKDREGRFMALNQRGCEYCGVAEEEEAFGKTDVDFFPHDRAANYQADDQAVMESGVPILNRIEAAPEAIGSPRLVVTSKLPLRCRQGIVIGVAGFSRKVEQFRERSESISRFASVVDDLHRNYGEPLTTLKLAQRAKLSPSQFDRRFRQAFGNSPRQYLLRVRVEAATRRLAESDETVSAIAQECGFHDHAHLSRMFKRVMGMTPTAYRRRSG